MRDIVRGTEYAESDSEEHMIEAVERLRSTIGEQVTERMAVLNRDQKVAKSKMKEVIGDPSWDTVIEGEDTKLRCTIQAHIDYEN